MTMQTKLLSYDPDDNQRKAVTIETSCPDCPARFTLEEDDCADAYRAGHKSGPEDATHVVEDIINFINDLQRDCVQDGPVQDNPVSDVHCEYCGSDDKMIQVVADGYEHAHESWCIVRKARELRAKLRESLEGENLIHQAESKRKSN